MGQQIRKVIKRRRRANYLKRKSEQAKLGGIATKKSAPKKAAESSAAPKKAVGAKKAAKKAPAKKVAKKSAEIEATEEISDAPATTVPAALESEQAEAVDAVAEGTAEVIDDLETTAPQPAEIEAADRESSEGSGEGAEG
jgi:hypothetical protein